MKRSLVVLAGMLWVFMCSLSGAEELPLWEAGFGFTSLSLPDYRGSNEQRGYLFPLPYIVYRGDILKLDRKGMRGLLFQSDRMQLNMSADAGVPVKSDQNMSRSGMPDLDPTVQIGPSLEICISDDCAGDRVIELRLPIRAVVASDFSRAYGIGFVANPQINVDLKNVVPGSRWNFGFALGPLFATEKYHDYYYQVSPQYSIPTVRPAYNAHGGYSGSLLIFSMSKQFNHLWFGSFARYDELSGAIFADSPLCKTRQSFIAGFVIAWVFGRSSVLVEASQ